MKKIEKLEKNEKYEEKNNTILLYLNVYSYNVMKYFYRA